MVLPRAALFCFYGWKYICLIILFLIAASVETLLIFHFLSTLQSSEEVLFWKNAKIWIPTWGNSCPTDMGEAKKSDPGFPYSENQPSRNNRCDFRAWFVNKCSDSGILALVAAMCLLVFGMIVQIIFEVKHGMARSSPATKRSEQYLLSVSY